MTFAEIIHPITIKEFFSEYYEKKMLHIKRDDAKFYHQFVSPEEIDSYVQLKQTYSPNVKLAFKGEEISPIAFSKQLSSVGAYQVDKEKLLSYFDKGYTIKYDKLHQTYPPVAKKVSALEQEIGIKIRTSLYITPPETQGYGIHTDRHDVLALQINGAKLWKVKMSDELLPSVYKTPINVDWEEDNEVEIIKVNSGDFFYCPRGLAHDVYTESESSTHFTIGFKPVYKYELLNELSTIAYKNESFRNAIPNNFSSNDEREEFISSFKKELHDLIDTVSAEDLLKTAEEGLKAKQLNIKKSRFASRFYEFDSSDLFKMDNCNKWTLTEDAFSIKLIQGAQSYNFPLQTKEVLKQFIDGATINYGNLDFQVNKNQSKKLVKRLVSINFLTLV